jgi:molybdenum cofactor cytidylyltransferase
MFDVVPVILAAGESSRMSFPKALLPLGPDTFLTRILKTLRTLPLPAALVILGSHASRIEPLMASHQVRVFVNPHPEQGQFSSMRLALENLHPECSGCLIWPVDQPLVSAALVHELIRFFLNSDAALALPDYEGMAGHPTIFGKALIGELLAAPSGANPKLIVARHKKNAVWLPTDERGTVEDIDTPEDYLRLTGETLTAALARHQRKHSERHK